MARARPFSHVVGFDDFPFDRDSRGRVPIVGAVFAGERLDGVLRGAVRRDGADATRELVRLLTRSKWAPNLELVFLQGIALGGFNVVDVAALARESGLPVLVVARRSPRLELIREALVERVRGGARKWRLIERAGPMEPVEGVFVQRAGLTLAEAARAIRRYAVNGRVPEPLRVAHLIAGGIGSGESRGRA